ncbi:hypothetical protein [Aliiruegeria lutimaris]|nr:hypothetical protein [Aliiruegeria lutimaris]
MAALLEDDSAWGPKGWLKPKEQILLATVAQERAYGKAESVSVSHEHGGTVLVAASISDRLQGVADKLPERRLQSAVQHERKRLQAEVVAIDQPSKTPSG